MTTSEISPIRQGSGHLAGHQVTIPEHEGGVAVAARLHSGLLRLQMRDDNPENEMLWNGQACCEAAFLFIGSVVNVLGHAEQRLSFQLRMLCFGQLRDGDIGVGVFPENEELLITGFRLCFISGKRARSAGLEIREGAGGRIHHDATIINDLLEFRWYAFLLTPFH